MGFNIKDASDTFGSFQSFGDIVRSVVNNAFVLAGIVAFVLLVFGGFSVIIGAGGDSKRLDRGKQTITYAVIGLILVVGSFMIIRILEKIGGVTILGN